MLLEAILTNLEKLNTVKRNYFKHLQIIINRKWEIVQAVVNMVCIIGRKRWMSDS